MSEKIAEKPVEKVETHAEKPAEKQTVKSAEPQAAPAPSVTPSPAPTHSRKYGKKAILHVYSSFNNTIVTATDLTGAETIVRQSGGMVMRAGGDKASPYSAMQVANAVAEDLKGKGFDEVDILIRAPGGTKSRSPGSGAQSLLRALTRAGMRLGKIEEVTPLPTGNMRKKGGKRGRRV